MIYIRQKLDKVDVKYAIQTVASITGVSTYLLRAWEKRYNAISPKRDERGRRYYTTKEVSRIKLLRALTVAGFAIGDVATKSDRELLSLLNTHGITHDAGELHLSSQIDGEILLHRILSAIKLHQMEIISHELTSIKHVMGIRDLVYKVISPLMGFIGRMVDKGELTIAQEHALSSLIKFHLGQFLYTSYETQNNTIPPVVIATPEGEWHEFGILLAALLCRFHHISFLYLGANLPVESLMQTVKGVGASKVILGVSGLVDNSQYLTELLIKSRGLDSVAVGGDGICFLESFRRRKKIELLRDFGHLESWLVKTCTLKW